MEYSILYATTQIIAVDGNATYTHLIDKLVYKNVDKFIISIVKTISCNTSLVNVIFTDTFKFNDKSLRFNNCKLLQTITGLNFLTIGSLGFLNCEALTSLNFNGIDSIITNMNLLFAGCINLETIDGINNWNTSAMTSMNAVFQNNYKLKYLNINNWDVSSMEINDTMFVNCNNLSTLILGPNCNISRFINDGGLTGTWTGGPETGYVYTKSPT